MRGIDVVVAHEGVIGADIVGEWPEQFRLEVHAGDEARDVVRRTPKKAVTHLGEGAVAFGALREFFAIARLEVVEVVGLAVFLVGHLRAPRRIGLEVVEFGNGLDGIAEGGMRRHIVDALVADIDRAPVAQPLDILLARLQHVFVPARTFRRRK